MSEANVIAKKPFDWVFLGTMAGWVTVTGLSVAALLYMLAPSAQDRTMCDRLVRTLFTTHDAIELQRAGILVREMGCSVSHRALQYLQPDE